jgi:TRAP-type mannitol/chloroaromatic compound transport system permease small subunit
VVQQLDRTGRALAWLGAFLGRLAGWLIVPIVVAVLAAVIGTYLRFGEIVTWGVDVPLFGTQLTITGLVELQWHLFAVMMLLGGSYALRANGHVRVDIVYDRMRPRTRALFDAIGHVVLLIPFCLLVAWLSLDFVDLAYRSGEESDYGGLTDRYLVKAMMPIGFVILALTALGQVLICLATVLDPARGGEDAHAR